ncbi:MAG TPA: FGGY-family carbohydrate kinase [Candidatus Ornithomonoglobus merdipullorum]|uniref:FGGY-family carbohydrate kinase n=1 Tax=Candidatus Ornithomonoglobus merdipullorum TaxID=2840895 RepID=A0A9D1MBU6_9FIRM|nr:FGGY-family carbohydrate kinase [Candidatus Ornithomonoglobus merdipullorum]
MKEYIEAGKAVLGIEFGSTRIKAVLIGEDRSPIASGSHDWENSLENGIWTYSLDAIWAGLQDCYAKMAEDVKAQYGAEITSLSAIGFSGMMHGYMAFDKNDELLVPFRTWRNTITEQASEQLTELFGYPIPQRWSIAHLYQAMLNGEEHVKDITFITTLAGYIHWMLSGEKVMGIGEASGMFPIDIEAKDFNKRMIAQFDEKAEAYPWKLEDILPKVLLAGDDAGKLTEKGAKLLDPTGTLKPGAPMCPPEGDAGTGMAATNSVRVRTGNISAGTSVFGMVVLEHELKEVHHEIDLVTTPDGNLVGMVHCNNCTSDLNAWVNCFKEFLESLGVDVSMPKIYDAFYYEAEKGDPDCGGLLAYNYFSGEHTTGFEEGRPLFVRKPDNKFSFANFAKVNLYTALGALKAGLDIMLVGEGVKLDRITGHGGLYKTPRVGQQITANAINAPVSVMKTAGEGGAWGIALLADYMISKEDGETLDAYLENKVFAGNEGSVIDPQPEEVDGFNEFMKRYKTGLAIERAAVDNLR